MQVKATAWEIKVGTTLSPLSPPLSPPLTSCDTLTGRSAGGERLTPSPPVEPFRDQEKVVCPHREREREGEGGREGGTEREM